MGVMPLIAMVALILDLGNAAAFSFVDRLSTQYPPITPSAPLHRMLSSPKAVAVEATITPPDLKEQVARTLIAYDQEPRLMPRIIWTFWDKGEVDLPEFLNICLESWRHNSPGWKVVVLSPSNLLDYLELGTDLPTTFFEIERASLQSDVARCAILARYGGIYTDMSTLAMTNVAEDVRTAIDRGTSVYAYHNFGWIHDFVSAWFMACRPQEPVMVEWSRTLNNILEGRVSDRDIQYHPYLNGIDLSDYNGPRPVGPNHPSKSWADYLIVNVALRALLCRNPRLAERFWRTARLIDHGHGNHLSPTRLFDHPTEVGVNADGRILQRLHWPDKPIYVSSQLLEPQAQEAMRTVALAPFVKFFQAGKVSVALKETGLNGLDSSTGIAQLIEFAFQLQQPLLTQQHSATLAPYDYGSALQSEFKVEECSRRKRRRDRATAKLSSLVRRVKPPPGSLLAPALKSRPLNRIRLWASALRTSALS